MLGSASRAGRVLALIATVHSAELPCWEGVPVFFDIAPAAFEQDRVFADPQERSSKSITFYDYVPSIDPLKIFKSKLVYKGIEKTGLNLYSVELNKTNLNLKVDSKGTPIFSSSKFGNFVLENRRVFLEKKRF